MSVVQSDKRKAKEIIKRLTPEKRLYAEYLDESKIFIRFFSQSKRHLPKGRSKVYRLDLISSECFKNQYLAAFVSRAWLAEIAPGCDAVASSEFSHIGLSAPPLIVIPGKTIPKRPGFSSIIEHEIAHVNQAILGELPDLDSCRVEDIFQELIWHTVAEYQAHFIQLAHDPTLMPPPEFDMDLEYWCHLRGFTSGLERVLHRILRDSIPVDTLKRLIRKMEVNLSIAFREQGLSAKIGRSFSKDIHRMIKVAYSNVQRISK